MRLLLPDGRLYGGADALLQIARRYWWAWPLYLLGHPPGAKLLLRAIYRRIARNRYCLSDICGISPLNAGGGDNIAPEKTGRPTSVEDLSMGRFVPLVLLPLLALCLIKQMAPWVFMWTLAFALYAGCKWLTYRVAKGTGIPATPMRAFIYLFAWPGMDAETFLRADNHPARPLPREYIFAFTKIVFGAVMVWVFTR